MAKDPGSKLPTASLFPIGQTSRTLRQSLNAQDRIDTWKFSLGSKSSSNLLLSRIAKGANVDVFLLNAAGRVIRALKNRGNKAEKFNNLSLDAGTYYVRVQLQPGSNQTQYSLSLSANPTEPLSNIGGASFDAATALSIGNTVGTLNDAVGSSAPEDFVKFTLTKPGQLSLTLTGLSADANLELYDRNRTLIAASKNSETGNESLVQRLIDFGSTYYIRVVQSSGDTNYSLSYSLTPDLPTTTSSGLQYVDLVPGSGAVPTTGKTILVHYTGTLENGTQFDSSRDRSRPFAFQLGIGAVIAGWDEGLSTMKVGGRRQLIIPSQLGYGATGVPGLIPANATLIFDVELLGIF